MTNSITVEDIYKLFQQFQEQDNLRRAELDRRLAEIAEAADRRNAELDRRLAELSEAADRRNAELDRRLTELSEAADRRSAEADRRSAELDRRLAELSEAADLRAAEAEERLARSEAIAAQANQAVSKLSGRWGLFVENLVAPGVVRLFQERGIAVKEMHRRMTADRGRVHLEVDIFAVDDTIAVVVEVKSRLTRKKVNRFLKDLAQFKVAFPAYKNYQIYGAVAGIEIDREVERHAYEKGLFVIKQSGEAVEITNDSEFVPAIW
jgi:hypothetical protein